MMTNLNKQLQVQDGGFELLLIKFSELEAVHEKLRIEPTKVIIANLLAVIKRLMESREEVTKAFILVVISIK